MADIPGRRIEPSIHILDPRFKYINAANTDVRKTFERIRAQQAAQATGNKVRRIGRSA